MNKKATDKQTCVQWLLDQWQMKNSHECPSFCQHMHLHVNSLHIYAGWYVRIVNFEWCYCRLDYRKRIPFPIEWYFLNKFHARRAHTVPKCNWNFFSRKKKKRFRMGERSMWNGMCKKWKWKRHPITVDYAENLSLLHVMHKNSPSTNSNASSKIRKFRMAMWK